ncbi:Diuretic hormone class 2 [Amphibalanus amphitrite]|uniref:Diuretic hormone class 2 n=1 Tax=Amphibalanus amphitrite TaxID=1232801 RepID=A0A6A4WV60_AMPAM|nr:Diuretic hormone class 2 [Amphibalanus amphitrite]
MTAVIPISLYAPDNLPALGCPVDPFQSPGDAAVGPHIVGGRSVVGTQSPPPPPPGSNMERAAAALLVLAAVTLGSLAAAGPRRAAADAVYLPDTRLWPLLIVNDKRNLDFGVGRGFSGALQAKHRMGWAAATDPSGPGRRR